MQDLRLGTDETPTKASGWLWKDGQLESVPLRPLMDHSLSFDQEDMEASGGRGYDEPEGYGGFLRRNQSFGRFSMRLVSSCSFVFVHSFLSFSHSFIQVSLILLSGFFLK